MSSHLTYDKTFVASIGRPFLARRIAQLHDLLADQGQAVMNEAGIDLDARLGSVFTLIAARPGLSVAELADELGLSHQLATYRVKKLEDDGLISRQRDPEDRTRSILRPTAKAEPVMQALTAEMKRIDQAYADLFDELGIDLLDLVIRAQAALQARPLQERVSGC